jgi:hypothetical protein
LYTRTTSSMVRYLPPFLGLLGAVILLLALLPHGIGVTSDCVDYFSTAANLVRGEGFLQHDSMPYASWPPMYPVLLAGGLKLGLSCEESALLINLISVFLLLWFLSRWMLLNLRNPFLAHWTSLIILLHFALLDVALHAWTEPLFNLMAMVFILRLPSRSRDARWRPLIVLALLASAAWLLRYVGVTLVALGGLFLLFSSDLSWRRRITRAGVFGLVATLPITLWMIRNVVLMGQMVGERSPSAFSLLFNIRRLLKAAWWIFPEAWGKTLPVLLFLVLITGITVLFFILRGKLRDKTLLRALLGFSALYLLLLLYTSSRFAFEAIQSRYLLPVFLPLLLCLALLLDIVFTALGRRRYRNILAAILSLWLLFPAMTSVRMIAEARSEGVDVFAAPVWQDWKLWDWLEGSPPEAILISNGADAVHYHTGLPVRLAPRKWMHSAGRTMTTELADFASIFEEDRPVFYIWISEFPRTGARVNYHSLEEILERYRLEPIAGFPKGAVFMVLPR